MKRYVKAPFLFLHKIWIILGITLALLLLCELTLSVAFIIREAIFPIPMTGDPRELADAYGGAEWPGQFFYEASKSGTMEWRPYVYCQRKSFHGKYINVDENGIRKTWHDGSLKANDSKIPVVFFFGGSTMWGQGSRDNGTIPSFVAKKLAEKNISARIVNLGEVGRVNTQELIVLLHNLQRGNIPDLAVFYDGFNDIYSSISQYEPGIPLNEKNRIAEFNTLQNKAFPYAYLMRYYDDNSSISRLVKSMHKRLYGDLPSSRNKNNSARSRVQEMQDMKQLKCAEEALSIYANNIKIIHALSKCYNFSVLFYWQPTIFDKKQLSPYEKQQFESKKYAQPAFKRINDIISSDEFNVKNEVPFRNIHDVFTSIQKPIFIDFCHICEDGNNIVADEIVTDIIPLIDQIKRKKNNTEH